MHYICNVLLVNLRDERIQEYIFGGLLLSCIEVVFANHYWYVFQSYLHFSNMLYKRCKLLQRAKLKHLAVARGPRFHFIPHTCDHAQVVCDSSFEL